MIKCQNSIVIANVQSVHHQLQAITPASSRLIWEIFYSLVDRSLWQVAPDNLKRFIEFGACFQLCFKRAVSLQHCTSYVIVHWVYIEGIWRPLVFCDDIWPRLDLSPPDSPYFHDHLTSSASPSPLLLSITPSFFHSNLKTFLFLKSYSP